MMDTEEAERGLPASAEMATTRDLLACFLALVLSCLACWSTSSAFSSLRSSISFWSSTLIFWSSWRAASGDAGGGAAAAAASAATSWPPANFSRMPRISSSVMSN